MFKKKTIRDIDLKDKRILLRTDYNVPLENGKITDDYRIKKSLPTIDYLIKQNCRIVVCSHLGRPDGKPTASLSLQPIAVRLSELLKKPVGFAPDCVGNETRKTVNTMSRGDVVVIENLRFHPEEEKNDDGFATDLAKLGDVFVQDAFGVVHRAHASTDAITRHLPSVSGLLLENEVDTITTVMNSPKRPLAAIVGGAKIADKIEVLNKFIEIADFIAVGGAMANTFLLAEGIPIASSLAEPDMVTTAKDVMKRAREKDKKQPFVFYLPQDAVVAKSMDRNAKTRIIDWSAHVVSDIENYPKRPPQSDRVMDKEEKILDIGPFSGAFIAGALQLAATVVWNGTMGVTETEGLQGPIGPFAHGTELVIEAMLGQFGHRPYSLVGGGDTAGYIEQRDLVSSFDHVSTGGGASLELMAGRKLPGVEALENK
jgi:phosphoglycerate kinase